MKADEAHVVGQRHPRQGDFMFAEIRAGADGIDVGQHVGMGQHHAFGVASRAGRELDEGRVLATAQVFKAPEKLTIAS